MTNRWYRLIYLISFGHFEVRLEAGIFKWISNNIIKRYWYYDRGASLLRKEGVLASHVTRVVMNQSCKEILNCRAICYVIVFYPIYYNFCRKIKTCHVLFALKSTILWECCSLLLLLLFVSRCLRETQLTVKKYTHRTKDEHLSLHHFSLFVVTTTTAIAVLVTSSSCRKSIHYCVKEVMKYK